MGVKFDCVEAGCLPHPDEKLTITPQPRLIIDGRKYRIIDAVPFMLVSMI